MGKTYVVYPDSLSHHGVKGMHWGVRKKVYNDAKSGAQAGSRIADRIDQRQKKKQKYDYSEISTMSDKELQQKINRINMERQYAKLTQPQVETGAHKAKEVLDTVGDVATVVIAIGGAYTAIKKIKKG